MALNTDSDLSTTAPTVEEEEIQQQTAQAVDQQNNAVFGDNPISTQPLKTENQDPPRSPTEILDHLNAKPKDELMVISEKIETSNKLEV